MDNQSSVHNLSRPCKVSGQKWELTIKILNSAHICNFMHVHDTMHKQLQLLKISQTCTLLPFTIRWNIVPSQQPSMHSWTKFLHARGVSLAHSSTSKSPRVVLTKTCMHTVPTVVPSSTIPLNAHYLHRRAQWSPSLQQDSEALLVLTFPVVGGSLMYIWLIFLDPQDLQPLTPTITHVTHAQ